MSMNKKGLGKVRCPMCQRAMVVRNDGRLRKHRPSQSAKGQVCEGSYLDMMKVIYPERPICQICAEEFDREAVTLTEPSHCFICQRFIPGTRLEDSIKPLTPELEDELAISHPTFGPDDFQQDFTDPEYVELAILSQIEDLSPTDRLKALENAMKVVKTQWHPDMPVGGYGIKYCDSPPALLPEISNGDSLIIMMGDTDCEVHARMDTRIEADMAYQKLAQRVNGPIGTYLIVDGRWVLLEGEAL